MRLLAIDTALGQCAACVQDTAAGEPLAAESLAMDKGHAEALLPLIERVVAQAGGGFASLDRIVVTVGPGSFTGIRVGLSAARAIGLAIERPVIGVTTLSTLMAPLMEDGPQRLIVAAIDARGGRVFAQAISQSGRLVIAPALLQVREVVRSLGSGPVTLVGSGAALVAREALAVGVDAHVQAGSTVPDMAWVARLGAAADPEEAPPKPLYIASPDARPQDGARLPRQ